MKLYDYSSLLKVVNEIDLETSKLKNTKEMALKNKYLELERQLLDSGLLEDWCRLSKLGYIDYYNRWRNKKLDNIYNKSDEFIEYDRDWRIKIMMSSGSHWSDYLCIDPRSSVNQGKLIWCVMHTTNYHGFERFNNVEKEYKTKILMIETLMETYEEYRDFMLQGLAKSIGAKLDNNASIKREITELM